MSLFRVDSNNPVDGPHQNQETVEFGVEPEQAVAGVVLLHGRGASARSILSIARELKLDNVCYRAPQAQNHTWYPHSFMEPIKSNEPGISSGLQAIHDLIDLYHDAGLSSEQIVLMGFSQGACLALEFAARHPQGYGAIVGFSGGLIGASVEFQHYYGSMEGTPIFLGCSEEDPHIPAERVDETAKLFRYLDASVTEKLYENLGHTINQDELSHARDLIEDITG
jgi:phospholipase/carboxylesterase